MRINGTLMNPVRKALWFVEHRSREAITLDEVARECDVSAYHLTRAFAATMGVPLMRYVRARRLTEAATRLAGGADDILAVALDVGYGSHEAFTRAFRDQFGLTPEQVRAQGHLNNVQTVEAFKMTAIPVTALAEPRIETHRPLLLAGIAQRYSIQSAQNLPEQWQRFAPYIGSIPGEVPNTTYGVVYAYEPEVSYDYLTGVEVKKRTELPDGLTLLEVHARKYAKFAHADHVAGIRSTFSAIFSTWFPQSNCKPAEAPTIEYYGPNFNPMTGLGGLEIWIPIQ